jgi:hypothetical protein
MMLIHEAGHLLAALLTGGRVQKLVFYPLAFSRSDIDPNPHRLIVTWCGPLFGTLLPLLVVLVIRACHSHSWLTIVFGAFCLLANGAYLTFGWLDSAGDAADLLNQGTPLPLLLLAGIPLIAGALYLFHILGPRLGLRKASRTDIVLATVSAIVLLTAGILIDGR